MPREARDRKINGVPEGKVRDSEAKKAAGIWGVEVEKFFYLSLITNRTTKYTVAKVNIKLGG